MTERESFEEWLQQQSQKPVHIESARQGWEAALSSFVPDGYKIEPTYMTTDGLRITRPDGEMDIIYPDEGPLQKLLCLLLSAAKEEGE